MERKKKIIQTVNINNRTPPFIVFTTTMTPRFFKVLNENENHNGFQYSVGLNVLKEEFNNNPNEECVPGGFYYTTLDNIHSFFEYGNHIREVFIPSDARTLEFTSISRNHKFRSDKIVLSEQSWSLKDFLREFHSQLDWESLSTCSILSEDFIRDFQNKLNFRWISRYTRLSEDFIREFKDKVEWNYISSSQTLSEEFMLEFQDRVYWPILSQCQTLSEDLIREFKDRVNWEEISIFQTLSEDFIREFKERVNWYCIYENQELSYDFLWEFIEKFSLVCRG
jgi:hypothetical protein